MRKPRLLLTFAVVAAVVAAGLIGPSRNDVADAAIGGITWADEFNAAAGTPADGSKWNFDLGGGGFGNNERQYYTNSTNNVVHDGQGNLVITARRENPSNLQCWYGTCQFTSARLLTAGRFTQLYGRFEARLRVPRGQGLWPAFWMLGDNIGSVGWPQCGEIDIMENVGRLPNTLFGTIHGPGYSGGAAIGGTRVFGAPLADDFHTFTVDWEPNSIIWYVDGSEYFRATPATLGGRQWVFDHPHFLILNLAIGGPFPGEPDAGTPFPATLTVDYVRVSGYAPGVTNPPVTQPPVTQPPVTQPPTQPPVTQPPTQPPAGGNAWAPYTSYTTGQVVTHNGVSYRVLQAHTSLPGWEPPNVAALFATM